MLPAPPRRPCSPMSLSHHHPAFELIAALRGASCPSSALRLYSLLRIRVRPTDPSRFAWRPAVLVLKPLSAAASLPLLSHFHAHLLRSNLLAYPHVASSLLRCYSLLSPALAHHLFDQIPPSTCNLVVVNVMLGSLCRSSDLASARAFFDGIPDKDVVSWSTMLTCYFSHSRLAEGLAFFRTMTFTTQLAADYVMLVTVLTGCASAGLLPVSCRAIHGYVVRREITFTMHLGTALINCYSKAGRLDYASRVFLRVPLRNVMHWTAMICGTAVHLGSEEAIRLFEEMSLSGVQPNEMTFTALLSACGHAGLVDQGRLFFELMVDKYGLEPTIHHYGCIVDLYAKAGKLEDAYKVIKAMRMEPNTIIWSSLLAACKKFKNFDIAGEGMEKVLTMEISEENSGLYALISDLYAMGGRWEAVIRVRRLMEERNVRKIRGSSSIKVGELTYWKKIRMVHGDDLRAYEYIIN
ncbi:hypothetical protein E2562_030952 [Oryza meyeriana var. granulata]|uniref:Pentacotripeptide-repeat region of PRORP domain-containing protein n=1 Tax=Oryza meyeriana var. granulata TaxID=110450 RepID=A0A6G1E5K2_9ORYZ|nr:hypothetical protein E2562_030952 [Oryza meyeriana var. granulata]